MAVGEPDDPALGAYGLRLSGVEAAADLLVPVDSAAQRYALGWELGSDRSPYEHVSGVRAELRLRSGGRIHIDRDAGSVCFQVPHPVRPDELVHPYLAPAAGVIGLWHGRESIHAGAVATAGAVWALVGDRGAGKSSTLAWLHRHVGLVCDDMLVLDGLRVLQGPRTIDLREDAAERLGLGENVGRTGARERWRLRLAPLAGELRLAGWVLLDWGDTFVLESLSARERLALLLEHRGVRLKPARPQAFVDYAALPAWRLRRPFGWSALDATGERLLELMSS